MGCCGGPRPIKKYSFKEYLVSAIAVAAFGLLIYLLKNNTWMVKHEY